MPFRVFADLCPHEGAQNDHAALVGGCVPASFPRGLQNGIARSSDRCSREIKRSISTRSNDSTCSRSILANCSSFDGAAGPSGGSGIRGRPRNKAHPAASMYSSVSSSKTALRMSSTHGSAQGKTRQSRLLSSVRLWARRRSTIFHCRRARRRMTCFRNSPNTYLASSTS